MSRSRNTTRGRRWHKSCRGRCAGLKREGAHARRQAERKALSRVDPDELIATSDIPGQRLEVANRWDHD